MQRSRSRTSLPLLRRARAIALATIAFLVTAGAANAAVTMSVLWTEKNSVPITPAATVSASNGDRLKAEILLTTSGGDGIQDYSVSLKFDESLDDELDILSASEFLPAGFGWNGTFGVAWQESSLIQEGQVYSFEAANDITWYPNGGGQFSLPTTSVGEAWIWDERQRFELKLDLSHEGIAADDDLELATVELRLANEAGVPLSDTENAMPLRMEYFADTSTGVTQAISLAGDADGDGLSNSDEVNTHTTDPLDADSDDDGLSDGDEFNTHSTDPLDPDSDGDGLSDGFEVAQGSDPNLLDTDEDDICDGPSDNGTESCTPGPDNCPNESNNAQTNNDALFAGDDCQCGDVNDDGIVTTLDAQIASEHLVGRTASGAFVATRCNVIGPSDNGVTDCDVRDVFVLRRAAAGRTPTIENSCTAFTNPDFCNGAETCTANWCVAGAAPCPGATCDEGMDICLPLDCTLDADCDDLDFCNGAETCVASVCVVGTPACVDAAHCDEVADTCLECVADGECADSDFCNGAETCVANSCVAGAEPCFDLAHCDETADTCLACLNDGECDDATYCNGSEVCTAGACTTGSNPCPGLVCDEVGQVCTAPVVGQYQDSFDRATLGTDWVIDNLTFAISGNQLIETAPQTFAPAQMRYQGGALGGATGTTEQYAKIQIQAPLTSTPAGFILNANDPTAALAGHYEVHFKGSSSEWRWEYGNPFYVATLDSCADAGPLAPLDWIGATITGADAATEVSVYRWNSDPDGGASVDVASNWGTADCTMQSAVGPFASGEYGGIRFYGSDPAQSRADNWSFGAIETDVPCSLDSDCDDGAWCTGTETCNAGACVPGTPTCVDAAHCDEGADTCFACIADGECADTDFCNGVETCSSNTCTAGTDPCPGETCDEGTDVCLPLGCTLAADCDDFDFCNGAETCVANTCIGGTPACVDAAHCDEVADTCLECVADGECADSDFCNGAETCVASSCVAGAEPCVDLAHCDETADTCLACLNDGECDDATYCNGSEVCTAGACATGSNPCPGLVCDEVGQVCTAPPGVAHADDFDRATLGPDWVIDNLTFAISGNQLIETAPQTFAPAQMRYRGGGSGGGVGATEQYAKIQIQAPLTSTPAGFILNANDPTTALAGHYEVHFKASNSEWRWEYGNPLFVATLDSCADAGPLAPLDWIGATITGADAATKVSVYRWNSDPDSGASVDVASNWGTADCTMQSAVGPFANGEYGGIRFYGSDPAQSHADNWSFGSAATTAACSTDADCDDGAWCNGVEFCAGGLCATGPGGCTHPGLCDETNDLCTAITTDPLAGSLWGLDNQGQTGGTAGADIDIANAWQLETGSSNVVVAVLDTGVDYTHEDLAARIWTNVDEIAGNGIDDDGNGYIDDTLGWDFFNDDNDPFDDGGHGTHIAGIVGAVGNNGVGVVGVNLDVQIMPLKIQSSSQVGTIAAAIAAIDYAVANGARVMTNSWAASAAWGEPGYDQPGFAPALAAAIEAANAAGVLFVATAGNSAEDKDLLPLFPASYPNDNVVAVAATDENDALATWSSFGPASVDLAAPGVGILSTVPPACFLLGPPPGGGACDGTGYLSASGTSMSTPHVAGVAALVLARFPGIALADLKDRLLFGTDPLPSLAGVTVSGGRLNAASALEDDTTAPGAVTDLIVSATTSTSITIDFTAPGDDAASGSARAYDIRYSTAPIDAGNFDSATPLANAPLPATAGAPESIEVDGLSPDTIYSFALRAIDNVGNRAAISNTGSDQTAP